MGQVGVREAAQRLGVGVARVHQRIADGSLPALRIGSQWVIDEAALSAVIESNTPGRPLSFRSAWALVALSQANQGVLDGLAPKERSRARQRLARLLDMSQAEPSETQIRSVAATLRSWLRNRADRRTYHAAPADLPDLRRDARVTLSGLSHPDSGIDSGAIAEAYLNAADLAALVEDYLLSPTGAHPDVNVVLHAIPADVASTSDGIGPLLLAADLAEHSGPREEAHASQLLQALASQQPPAAQTPDAPTRSRRSTT